MNADQLAALNLHQRARAELSIAPLTWAFHLANDAQQHANKLAAADHGVQHSQLLHHQGQGENLASLSGYWPDPYTEASRLWYAEKEDWLGGSVRSHGGPETGHYTQMVWSTTTHIGMALATAVSGTMYIVARYSPPGNRIGHSPLPTSGYGGHQFPTGGTSQVPTLQETPALRSSLHVRFPSEGLPVPQGAPYQQDPMSHHPWYGSGSCLPRPRMGPPQAPYPGVQTAYGQPCEVPYPRDDNRDNVVHTRLCTIL